MKKPKLIYIYPAKSSFINSDIAFLSKKYSVKTQDLDWKNPLKLPINFALQKLFLLYHFFGAKAILISFAGYFSLLPVLFGKVFRKKVLIILNGTECISFPAYNYGSLRKKVLRFFVKKSQQYATKLLPVDASLITQKHTFDDSVIQKNQGFLSFFPNIKTPFSVIPNGFDIDFWKAERNMVVPNSVITVASISSENMLRFKGIDLLIELAKRQPAIQFTIVGFSEEMIAKTSVPKNVTIYNFVSLEKLKELYAKHQFYFQLSVNEGFGCALAESMLCGCIPIVSNSGALPNLVGKNGYIVNKKNINELESVFLKATELSEEEKKERSKNAQNHVKDNFSISNREQLILQEITSD